MGEKRECFANRVSHPVWARMPAVRVLHIATLTVSLVSAVAFLLIEHRGLPADGLDHPAHPINDEQAQAQVVDAANEIITGAGLPHVTGGYLAQSCKNENDPPYQGTLYLNFTLRPDAGTHLRAITATMSRSGWRVGSPPSQHLSGATWVKDGIRAVVYPQRDVDNLGILQIYGQCRNMTAHHGEGWIDISHQLARAR